MDSPQPHSYATRIRHNIDIKPAPRRRNSPDLPQRPRKIKPSTQKPNASPATQPTPSNFPHFPPPNITLHPDDANNKVFLAIARSFLSVDNRALTIKDLAEMTVQFGLVCQNVSAASQAITTYIRTHMHRCEVQQDHPLLLRHILSGSPSDDDLLPALHSRSGGAHLPCPKEADKPLTSDHSQDDSTATRTTNFRKGTMVWYLSRVTGAPCPFTRAGIRLCDYAEGANDVRKESKSKSAKSEGRRLRQRERESKRIAAKAETDVPAETEQCGQKRKRSSAGGCSVRFSSNSSDDDSSSSEPSREPPPTRPKLMLRLKPLAQIKASAQASGSTSTQPISIDESDSESDSESDDGMSIDSSSEDEDDNRNHTLLSKPIDDDKDKSCLPPYPRRSISIPLYTPSTDFSSKYTSYPLYNDNTTAYPHRSTRSPSVPHSVGSPPPDSDDDDDDFHISMIDGQSSPPPLQRGSRRASRVQSHMDLDDEDFEDFSSSDADEEDEGEIDGVSAQGSSPGPRSPSAPLIAPSPSLHLYNAYLSEPRVKEEPRDVQGMLDAWEEDLDHLNDYNQYEVIGRAAACVLKGTTIPTAVKVEEPVFGGVGVGGVDDTWDWESGYKDYFSSSTSAASPYHESTSSASPPTSTAIKQEEELDNLNNSSFSLYHTRAPLDLSMSFQQYRSDSADHPSSSPLMSPLSAVSPTSPFSEEHGMFSPFAFGYPTPESPLDSYSLRRESDWANSNATFRPRAKTVPSLGFGGFFNNPVQEQNSSATSSSVPAFASSSTPPPPPQSAPATSPEIAQSLTSLIQELSLSMNTSSIPSPLLAQQPCVAPKDIDMKGWGGAMASGSSILTGHSPTPGGLLTDAVIVKTCEKCEPDIWATQVEGISVYQTILGPHTLLRRIDTDFVNITPISVYAHAPTPVLSTIPGAVVISPQGSASSSTTLIHGLWVPLSSAQAYLTDHPIPGGPSFQQALEVFLSDCLVDRFPLALREFVSGTRREGKGTNEQFGKAFGSMVQPRELVPLPSSLAALQMEQAREQPVLHLPVLMSPQDELAEQQARDLPLSPSEQEIFQALCANPEWEADSPSSSSSKTPPAGVAVLDLSSTKDDNQMDTDDWAARSLLTPTTPTQTMAYAQRHSVPATAQAASSGPLRRSKRVADAVMAKSRTTSRRRAARNSP